MKLIVSFSTRVSVDEIRKRSRFQKKTKEDCSGFNLIFKSDLIILFSFNTLTTKYQTDTHVKTLMRKCKGFINSISLGISRDIKLLLLQSTAI